MSHETKHPCRGSPAARTVSLSQISIIRWLLLMCFIVNVLLLLSLQLTAYQPKDLTLMLHTTDVSHKVQELPLTDTREQQQQSPTLRRLHQVANSELQTLNTHSEVSAGGSEALSPFVNWTRGIKTEWEKTRDSFNPDDIIFNINQSDMCSDEPFLVVIVTSSIGNEAQRQAIRDTWGSVSKKRGGKVLVLFLLGTPQWPNATLSGMVMKESKTHRDIVQASITDSYSNLAFKSIAMLRWMNKYCTAAKHLLKSDDDMYLNIDTLHTELQHSMHTRFIMGEIIAGAQPVQDKRSKWFTPTALFPQPRYPKYVSGSAYVISADLISDLYTATLQSDIFWLEDVYITGLCAKTVGATHISNSKFGYKERRLSPCVFRAIITGHRLSTAQMRQIWSAVIDRNLDCSKAR